MKVVWGVHVEKKWIDGAAKNLNTWEWGISEKIEIGAGEWGGGKKDVQANGGHVHWGQLVKVIAHHIIHF